MAPEELFSGNTEMKKKKNKLHELGKHFQKRCMQCNAIMNIDYYCGICGNSWHLYYSQIVRIILEGYLEGDFKFGRCERILDVIELVKENAKRKDKTEERVEIFLLYRKVFGSKEYRKNRGGITCQLIAIDKGLSDL